MAVLAHALTLGTANRCCFSVLVFVKAVSVFAFLVI